jgi:hypothetical protein
MLSSEAGVNRLMVLWVELFQYISVAQINFLHISGKLLVRDEALDERCEGT